MTTPTSKKNHYVVTVREVHCRELIVDATSKEDALDVADNLLGNASVNAEYSWTYDKDVWDVELLSVSIPSVEDS